MLSPSSLCSGRDDEKNEDDIDLVVSWDIGDSWKKKYYVASLLDFDNIHHRQFHGLTHLFYDDTSDKLKFSAIILSELVRYLNNMDDEQELQKKKYGTVL